MLIFCILQLSACFPVIATSIVASAVAVTDRRTAGIIVEDETIEIKFLSEKVRSYSSKDGVSVSATSFNRTVLLTGWVPNEGIKKEVASLAARIENVREIVNELNIGPPVTSATYGKDTILTTKVKASFIDEDNLNGIVVKVKTESAVVYLMGIVTEKEASLAADIASRIVGTKRVVRAFEIVSVEEVKKLESLVGK
jgi:osmotically-inducible protein OsmY